VVRLFRDRPNSVAVMGNHVRGIFSYAQEITRLQLGDDHTSVVEWMRALPYHVETADVPVVHVGLVPGVPLSRRPGTTRTGRLELGEEEVRFRSTRAAVAQPVGRPGR
jgi:hypothetical protein